MPALFEEDLHPRRRGGQFRKKGFLRAMAEKLEAEAKKLDASKGESIKLKDGSTVKAKPAPKTNGTTGRAFEVRDKDGNLQAEADTPAEAAERALTVSAKSTDPNSLGGDVSLRSASAAEDRVIEVEGKKLNENNTEEVAEELERLDELGEHDTPEYRRLERIHRANEAAAERERNIRKDSEYEAERTGKDPRVARKEADFKVEQANPSIPSQVKTIDPGADFLGYLPDGSTVWGTVRKQSSGTEQDRVVVAKPNGELRNASDADMGKVSQKAPARVAKAARGPRPKSEREILQMQRSGRITYDQAQRMRKQREEWDANDPAKKRKAAASEAKLEAVRAEARARMASQKTGTEPTSGKRFDSVAKDREKAAADAEKAKTPAERKRERAAARRKAKREGSGSDTTTARSATPKTAQTDGGEDGKKKARGLRAKARKAEAQGNSEAAAAFRRQAAAALKGDGKQEELFPKKKETYYDKEKEQDEKGKTVPQKSPSEKREQEKYEKKREERKRKIDEKKTNRRTGKTETDDQAVARASARAKAINKTKLPEGYRIEDSGDPQAPYEVIRPDGGTVTVQKTRKDAIEIAQADVKEQAYLNGPTKALTGKTNDEIKQDAFTQSIYDEKTKQAQMRILQMKNGDTLDMGMGVVVHRTEFTENRDTPLQMYVVSKIGENAEQEFGVMANTLDAVDVVLDAVRRKTGNRKITQSREGRRPKDDAPAKGPKAEHKVGDEVWDREKIEQHARDEAAGNRFDPPVGEVLEVRNVDGKVEYLVSWGDTKTENWEPGYVLFSDAEGKKLVQAEASPLKYRKSSGGEYRSTDGNYKIVGPDRRNGESGRIPWQIYYQGELLTSATNLKLAKARVEKHRKDKRNG